MPLASVIFETELGWMGLVWRTDAIVRVLMPQHRREAVERRAARLDAPSASIGDAPEYIGATVGMIRRYAAGEPVGFSSTPVNAGQVEPMRAAIYAALRGVGYGETLTYGELAALAGYPGMAREIGEAMGMNPTPIIVPCHRVVAAGGKIGGFSAPGGASTKRRLLELEGARLVPPTPAQEAFAF